MLELKYKGQSFELPEGTIISMELNNPIFDEDLIKGSYSFPFKFPLTARNRRTLSFPDEINNILPFQRNLDGVILTVDGIPMFTGSLILRKIENQMVDAYLLVGNAAVNEFASNTKLVELISHTLSFANSSALKAHMTATTMGTVEDFPYVFFPVTNMDFYRRPEVDLNVVTPTIQNYYLNDAFVVEEQLERTDALEPVTPVVAVTPFPYVTYLLRQAFKNYRFRYNIFELDEELKTLVLYSNTGLARFEKKMVFGIEYWFNINDRSIDLKAHVPDMTVADLVIGQKNIFCLYFYVDLADGRLEFGALKDLMARPVDIDWTAKTSPDVDIWNDFLQGLKYVPDFKEDRAREELTRSIKGFPIRPYSQAPILPQPNDPNLYYYEGQGYYKWENGNPLYQLYSGEFTDYYISADPKFEVKPRITPLMVKQIRHYNEPGSPGVFQTSKNPYVKIAGNFYDREAKINSNKVTPRVTFYRGYQQDLQFNLYPMGSSDNFSEDAVPMVGKKYSMSWDGLYGLHNVWWKNYMHMRQFGRKTNREVRLTHMDLSTLDLTRKIRVENANYFIKKMNFDLPLTRPAKVELWKVD